MEKNVLIDKVSAGYEHSLIIYENGNVYCIGFIDILLTIIRNFDFIYYMIRLNFQFV